MRQLAHLTAFATTSLLVCALASAVVGAVRPAHRAPVGRALDSGGRARLVVVSTVDEFRSFSAEVYDEAPSVGWGDDETRDDAYETPAAGVDEVYDDEKAVFYHESDDGPASRAKTDLRWLVVSAYNGLPAPGSSTPSPNHVHVHFF